MKTIGFIDYYLDEWHANQYPAWIEQATGGSMKVTYAYGKKDSDTGLDNVSWSNQKGIELLGSIEEVVAKSDYLIVLSPDNPEQHEELAKLALQSGKPTYVDKTFATDRASALRMFELANQHGTPLYSSSALRFATEYAGTNKEGIDSICSIGPGHFDNYSIHQIEPIISLMGSGAERVMFIGTPNAPALLIEFSGGRKATIHHYANLGFGLSIQYASGASAQVKPESDFFAEFIRNMVQFFETGKPTVDSAETIAIISIIEAGFQAAKTPHQWIELPRG